MQVERGIVAEDPPARALPAKPHICFVAPYAWPVLSRDSRLGIVGGAEVQQAVLARVFRRAGYQVTVVSQDFGQPDGVEVDGIVVRKVYRQGDGIPVLRFIHPRLTLMWKVMREVGADVYYQRSAAHLTAFVAEFCRRNGKRSIYAGASNRDFEPGRQQIEFTRDRWLFEHGLRTVDAVVVQNAKQQEDVLRHYGRRSTLIPSCYELPEKRSNSSEDLVLWVGTIHDYKQPEIFLELARRLPHRRFVMIGGSAAPGDRQRHGYYESIRDAAAKLPNLRFLGFQPLEAVESWFDRGRILVNTSVYEGMPNTFLQAWARGIPTVATVDVGAGIYPVFSDAEKGAQEIERLFTDELHWARSSARAREHFEQSHSGKEVLARYGALFKALSD